jgi:hypothetical protein
MESTRAGTSADVKAGVRTAVAVILLVLAISVLQLLAGKPIAALGTIQSSLAYCVLVYVPLILVCAVAYRRAGR